MESTLKTSEKGVVQYYLSVSIVTTLEVSSPLPKESLSPHTPTARGAGRTSAAPRPVYSLGESPVWTLILL